MLKVSILFDGVLKPENGRLSGVFCDIAGTLVMSDKQGKFHVNEDVVAYLRYARDVQNMRITLCSRIEENALAPLDLRREFGFVYAKVGLSYSTLEVLIDNNPAEYLEADTVIRPESLIGLAACQSLWGGAMNVAPRVGG